MEECHKQFCRYYRNQIGGALPVFSGYDQEQRGEGLGDIFRSILRFLSPIAQSAATKFITTTSKGLEEGQSVGQAAKSALMPTLSEALMSGAQQGMARMGGKGRKRRRRRTSKRGGRKSKRTSGGEKKIRNRKRVYKGKRKNTKRIRFLPTNF